MPFRDKDVALRSQVEDLEEELEAVRRENQELKSPSSSEPAAAPRGLWVGLGVAVSLGTIAVVAAFTIGGSTGESIGLIVAPLAVLVLTAVVVMVVISRLLYVASPNEVLVISGRQVRAADGSTRGYRLVRGGRALKIPMLEQVDYMSLQVIPIELNLRDAYCKNGSVDVIAHAVVRIAGSEPLLNNAVERFLGRSRSEVANVAQQTLEGSLRGVVAKLSADDLREDSLKVAEFVIQEADHDFNTLGLELDAFKIQRVTPVAD